MHWWCGKFTPVIKYQTINTDCFAKEIIFHYFYRNVIFRCRLILYVLGLFLLSWELNFWFILSEPIFVADVLWDSQFLQLTVWIGTSLILCFESSAFQESSWQRDGSREAWLDTYAGILQTEHPFSAVMVSSRHLSCSAALALHSRKCIDILATIISNENYRRTK